MMTTDLGDFTVVHRGWLSSNNILFVRHPSTAVVDTGYASHAPQTLALIRFALNGRPLDRIVNTHLHSDHCGGNALLQAEYPDVQTLIAPGQAPAVSQWRASELSYDATGQTCPRFQYQGILQQGQCIRLGEHDWEIHASPGHDAHSVVLFEPRSRTLISADALWENGFGVVFQELDGEQAFDAVAATLDMIERLSPAMVIPGHGAVFTDVQAALTRARTRLAMFVRDPVAHAKYGAKVLIKFRLLEKQTCSYAALRTWVWSTPYFSTIYQTHFKDLEQDAWLDLLLQDLKRSKAIDVLQSRIVNLS